MKFFFLSIVLIGCTSVASAGISGFDCDTQTWELNQCKNGVAMLGVCVKNRNGAFEEVSGLNSKADVLDCKLNEIHPLQKLTENLCERYKRAETKNKTFTFPSNIELLVPLTKDKYEPRKKYYGKIEVSDLLKNCN